MEKQNKLVPGIIDESEMSALILKIVTTLPIDNRFVGLSNDEIELVEALAAANRLVWSEYTSEIYVDNIQWTTLCEYVYLRYVKYTNRR